MPKRYFVEPYLAPLGSGDSYDAYNVIRRAGGPLHPETVMATCMVKSHAASIAVALNKVDAERKSMFKKGKRNA